MAADNEEQLVLDIVAKLGELEKQMAKANQITARAYRDMSANSRRATRQMEQDAIRSAVRINQAMATVGNRIGDFGKAFAVGLVSKVSLQAATQLVDEATKITNALKVTGLEGEALEVVYGKLFAAAQKNAAPIESLTTLYSKLALTQKELGVSQQELIGFTDKVALALRVGGTDAQQASGALLQLSQALGGGVVRAEEFNSVLEGAPTIMQAVAAGLKEAGGSVAQLRKLVVDGKVSSEAFFRAFEAGAVTLESKVAGAEMTVAQQFVRLQNVLIDTAGKIDKATGAAGKMGGAIETLSRTIEEFGRVVERTSESDLASLLGWFSSAIEKANQFKDVMGGVLGIITKMSTINSDIMNGRPIGTTLNEENIQNRIDAAFEGTGATPKTKRLPESPKVETVSLDDYALPKDTKKSRKGGGGKAKNADDRFSEDVQSIRDRIAAMKEEQAALGMTFVEQQKRKIALDLEQQALKDVREEARKKGDQDWQNKELSASQRQSIDEVSEAYARQADSLRVATEAMDLRRDVLKGAFSDVRSALRDGNFGWDDFANVALNALDKIINKIEDDLIDALLNMGRAGAGSSGGGILGSLFSGFFGLFSAKGNAFSSGGVHAFAKGGAFTNKIVDQPTTFRFANGTGLMGEAGPEAIVPLSRDQNGRLGVSMMGGSQRSQAVHVTTDVRVSVDDDGKLKAVAQKTAKQEVQNSAPAILRAASQQVVPTMEKYQADKAGGEWRS